MQNCLCYKERKFFPDADMESTFYLRLAVADRPGVLAKIAALFGDHGVSIAVGNHRKNFHDAVLIDRAEHHHHFVGIDLAGAVGDGLIEQAQGVAHAATGGL